MVERFVYSTGTISVETDSSVVTGTGTSWSGRDREGAMLYALPVSSDSPAAAMESYIVGAVAAVSPRGEYENGSLPLVKPYRGPPLVNVEYMLVDGPAIANGATQAAIYARFAAFLEQNAGLVLNSADDVDYALVPNNSFVVDDSNNVLKQWRNGVLNNVYAQFLGADMAAQPFGPLTDIAAATTTNLGTLNTVGFNITGTGVTITGFGTSTNRLRMGTIASAGVILDHNPAAIILPTGADITSEAGDSFIAISSGSGVWTVLAYWRKTGRALVQPTLVELGGVAKAGDTMTGPLTLDDGTTSNAALTFANGALLTTPAAGAHEFTSGIFYKTPVASARAVDMIEFFKALTADEGATNGTSAQPWFPTAGGITLPGSTSFFFEGLLLLTNGTTSHTTGLGFGGTATLTSIDYVARLIGGNANAIITTISSIWINTASNTVLNSGVTVASTVIEVRGVIRINAGGTLIPQFTFSAAPGGTNTVKRNSFFRLTPIGSNSVASVGNWA